MPATIWIDVEDLFEYARENSRPSGIQRLAFEIGQALLLHPACAGRVQFVRHAPVRNGFRVVDWSEVACLFGDLAGAQVQAGAPAPAGQARTRGRQIIRRLVQRLPGSLRPLLTEALLHSAAALGAWGRLLKSLAVAAIHPATRLLGGPRKPQASPASPAADAKGISFNAAARPGDVILVLGSPWFHPDYAGLIRRHRDRYGLRFAMLVYDLIPLRRPEWCDAGLVRLFRAWFIPTLPLCDHVLAISRATAADVGAYASHHGVTLPGRIATIPIGTGLNTPAMAAPGRRLPAPGSYALIVATIEVRKNHLLLFRIWRQLLEDMPRDRVPTLVFAGRIGWLVEDLMRQIRNTDYLDGKLVVVESPTDGELAALYGGCLFTLFPSFYEGWGLPVTESLAFGKPCLIANRTSLPEAGGTLARSFDPDNLHDAYQVIRGVIEDPPGLARWAAQVRQAFEPVPWSATAAAVLAGLGLADFGAQTTDSQAVT